MHDKFHQSEIEPAIIFHARAARDIAARFGSAAFARDQIPADVRLVLLCGDVIETCQYRRGLRLTLYGRCLAASSPRYRNVERETYRDRFAYMLNSRAPID